MTSPYRKPMVILVDLDSTLCLTEHRHHLAPTVDPSSSWATFAMACADDEPNWGVIIALNLHRNAGCVIHLVSGREPEAYEITEAWLQRHGVAYDNLVLFGAGVGSATNIENKVGYIRRIRELGMEPVLAYEDWPVVAEAIRAAGVPVIVINPMYHDMSWDQAVAPEHENLASVDG